MDTESKRKKFIADLVQQLDTTNREDWQRRSIALIKLKAAITDPETPLKFTAREITQLRVVLFQQLEDLRSTIVKEACNIVAKMVDNDGHLSSILSAIDRFYHTHTHTHTHTH
jgi:hypothetical protein